MEQGMLSALPTNLKPNREIVLVSLVAATAAAVFLLGRRQQAIEADIKHIGLALALSNKQQSHENK